VAGITYPMWLSAAWSATKLVQRGRCPGRLTSILSHGLMRCPFVGTVEIMLKMSETGEA
jgi:hypothetical protein